MSEPLNTGGPQTEQEHSPHLFFILGSPRSGTTLLQSVCMSAEGVHVPSETHFLTRFPLARPLKSVAQWERALREVEEYALRDETPLEGLREVASYIAQAEGRGHAQLLRAWLTAAARPFGAQWMGEASNVHTRDTLTLAKLAPHAKLIHVIRDPRDVAASQREAWGASVTRAALRWRDELLTHKRALMSLSAERYRVIYYERLVSAPQEEIRALCGWFGWPFHEAMCTPHKRAHKGFAEREVHKERTLEPITPSRVGRWRHALSAQEARQVELICGPLMRELGYELSPPSIPLSLSVLPSLSREALKVAQSYATRRLKVEFSGMKERLQGLASWSEQGIEQSIKQSTPSAHPSAYPSQEECKENSPKERDL